MSKIISSAIAVSAVGVCSILSGIFNVNVLPSQAKSLTKLQEPCYHISGTPQYKEDCNKSIEDSTQPRKKTPFAIPTTPKRTPGFEDPIVCIIKRNGVYTYDCSNVPVKPKKTLK